MTLLAVKKREIKTFYCKHSVLTFLNWCNLIVIDRLIVRFGKIGPFFKGSHEIFFQFRVVHDKIERVHLSYNRVDQSNQ